MERLLGNERYEHKADAVRRALEKVRGENKVRQAIEADMSAREVFDTFGIMAIISSLDKSQETGFLIV